MRDPNADMMYYVRNNPKMPKMARRKENFDIDQTKGAAEHLFDECQQDGDFVLMDQDAIVNDNEIDAFTDRMSLRWGEEESQLRMAVFVAFVNN